MSGFRLPSREKSCQLGYAALLAFVVLLVTLSLLVSKSFFGWYARPAFFSLFRLLDFLQLGLLAALAVAGTALLARRVQRPVGRLLLVLPALIGALWLVVWAVVHAGFGIRLSVPQVWDLLVEPHSIELVGLARGQVLGTIMVLLLLAAALAGVIQAAATRSSARFVRRTLLFLLAGFLLIHGAVRSYFSYHIARSQRAVLMLDEGGPLALRSETLVPGLARRPLQFPSEEAPARTRAYLAWAASAPRVEIPHKLSVLWVSIESLRFDAISDSTMPYLFAHRHEFQLRLDQDHWSGGNATKPGTFSMLTGLAAAHLQAFRRAGIAFPLLTLLGANGYRLRIAKGLSFSYGDLRAFLPSEAEVSEVSAPSMPGSDRAMVDSLLLDLERRDPARPAFDLLTFDATHWPYDDPERYRQTGPAKRAERIYRAIRSEEAVRLGRIRYARSLRFIDAELQQVLERLREQGQLAHTVVILTGDHGEEFLERGQLGHSSGMNDFQARVPLWIHFPGSPALSAGCVGLTSHLDIVPTLLDYFGFENDVLRTQGRSLLRREPPRSLLMLAEQGWAEPAYHAIVSATYVSRWRVSGHQFLFSSVERRDGAPVQGDAWWQEVQAGRAEAAAGYELLPDVQQPAPRFTAGKRP